MNMDASYIPRSLEPVIKRAVDEFPVLALVGPRQSGKTTLLKRLYESHYPIVSLETPDVRLAALGDPRGFLNLHPSPVIFDEIQYVPELLPYIKERVDVRRREAGQYILTGSQNLLLMQQVTESLAGRAAILKLLPLSRWELNREGQRPLYWEQPGGLLPHRSLNELWDQILRGFYPEIAGQPGRDSRLWHASYIQTYLERDVRSLRNIGDLTQFQTFLRALAARAAQILNISEVARDVGVSVNTVKAWISLLEASFQVFLLRPYYANVGKRLVKSPKLYFMDTGLLCHLVGLRDVEHAASGPMGGAIFENMVVADILKMHMHRGDEPALYYWRTSHGSEVDLILDTQMGLIPMEIKLAETLRPEAAKGIVSFRADFGKKAAPGYVIFPGDQVLPLAESITSLPLELL